MKLHTTVIEKLIRLYETHSGHRNETRLKNILGDLDVSIYERTSGEKIVVLTEQLNEEIENVQSPR